MQGKRFFRFDIFYYLHLIWVSMFVYSLKRNQEISYCFQRNNQSVFYYTRNILYGIFKNICSKWNEYSHYVQSRIWVVWTVQWSQKRLCVEDLEYRKEKCFFDELEKYLIGKYNCSTPFTPKKISVQGDIVRFSPISKDNICTNQSIAIKVLSTYREWKKHEFKKSNCNKPCHNILMRDHTLVFPELLTDNVR